MNQKTYDTAMAYLTIAMTAVIVLIGAAVVVGAWKWVMQ